MGLQRFCVKHRCVGVFEVKVDLKSYENGFKLLVQYPSSIAVNVQANPEAIYLGPKIGILSCRVPIVDHDIEVETVYNPNKHKSNFHNVLGAKKKRKFKKNLDGKLS